MQAKSGEALPDFLYLLARVWTKRRIALFRSKIDKKREIKMKNNRNDRNKATCQSNTQLIVCLSSS